MTDVPPPPPPANYSGGAGQPSMPNPLVNYWKRVVLERYAQFTGRSGRAEFWWYFLAGIIIAIAFNILVAIASIFWVIYVIYALRARKLRYGVASLCIGGGMGIAMVIETR